MTAVFIIAMIALLAGLALSYANRSLPAQASGLIEQVNDLLPQTQCAQCGYPGCRPYAAAIVDDGISINLCPPGGDETVRRLADLLGKEVLPLADQAMIERSVAVIDEQPHHVHQPVCVFVVHGLDERIGVDRFAGCGSTRGCDERDASGREKPMQRPDGDSAHVSSVPRRHWRGERSYPSSPHTVSPYSRARRFSSVNGSTSSLSIRARAASSPPAASSRIRTNSVMA